MAKTQAGIEAWALICHITAPALPPVSTKTAIKDVAYRTLKAGKDFPHSRIDEAAQERCGWKATARIKQRAIELGHIKPDSPWKMETREPVNDNALLHRLIAMQRNAFGADRDALEVAINQIKATLP